MKWSALAGLLSTASLASAATLNAGLMERSMDMASSDMVAIVQEVVVIWVNYGGGSKTTTKNAVSSTAGATQAIHTVGSPKDNPSLIFTNEYQVMVGGSAGLVYTPNSISASVGDMVVFQFMSNNHTATQSPFATPCIPLAGGFDSGFMPNVNNSIVPPPQMAMHVKVSTPICKHYAGTAEH
jgi:plastocyanin